VERVPSAAGHRDATPFALLAEDEVAASLMLIILRVAPV
jgi:hypothetical protein